MSADEEKQSEQLGLFPDLEFVAGFKSVGEAIVTDFSCPSCLYEWSGRPRPEGCLESYCCPRCKHAWSGQAKAATARRAVFGSKVSSGASVVERVDKPPYRVPLMSEIARLPWNGCTVVSSFSGCGGSCLGFKMLGFRVAWASEFVPAARDTYRANHPGTILDDRDIRKVQPEEILNAIGLKAGEVDVLEGSPPCFEAGTPVLTRRGLVPIEHVVVGDMVLTHKLRWKKVTSVSSREARTVLLEDRIAVTGDHLFLSRESSKLRGPITLGVESWKAVGKLQKSFCATPVDFPYATPPVPPEGFIYSEDFWYCVGRWIGDGWVRLHPGDPVRPAKDRLPQHRSPIPCKVCGEPSRKHSRAGFNYYGNYCSRRHMKEHNRRLKRHPRWGVMLCSSFFEGSELKRRLDRLGVPVAMGTVKHTRRFIINRKSLVLWLLKYFGRHATGKTLPAWVFGMREDWRHWLFEGYIDADGSKGERGKIITGTVSRCLASGMTLLAGTFGYTTSFLARKRAHDVIEGRKVKTHQSYTMGFTPDDGRYTQVQDGIRWRRMRRPLKPGKDNVTVYDLEVDEDHSFLADTFFVHNCASFSTAGKRDVDSRQGKRKYSDTKQRTDDLFYEFTRLLEGLRPKVFIAENVSGLTKGAAKGYFLDILGALKDCGYVVEVKVLDAQYLGVPQMRARAIFMGVRRDLGARPIWPDPLPYGYTVRDALPWLVALDKDLNLKREFDAELSADRPAPTVPATKEGGSWPGYSAEMEVERVPLRAIHDTSGQFSQGDITDRPCPAITVGVNALDSYHYQIEEALVPKHQPDLIPPPVEPESDMSRFATGAEWDKVPVGGQSEKYFQLTKPDPERPCPTVTQLGGNAGLASVCHPTEKRKFSIGELKRICGFPDDFVLTGSYAQQWERLGRAVPPVMMAHVARCVLKVLEGSRNNQGG